MFEHDNFMQVADYKNKPTYGRNKAANPQLLISFLLRYIC